AEQRSCPEPVRPASLGGSSHSSNETKSKRRLPIDRLGTRSRLESGDRLIQHAPAVRSSPAPVHGPNFSVAAVASGRALASDPSASTDNREASPVQLNITFRNLDASDALKDYAREKIERVHKYLDRAGEAHVVLSLERHLHHADITIHSGSFIL